MQPLSSRAEPAAAGAELSIATSSSSAAGRPARPSPRCSPKRGRDVVVVEKAPPPALSHRRVAAAGQRRPVRPPRRARARSRRSACRSTASSSSRPTTSIASSSSSPRPGTSRCPTPGRCAAPSSTSCCSATPPAKGARTFEGQRVREVAFDADGATRRRSSSTTARGAAGARASSSTRPAATPCSRTSCAARRRTQAPQQLGALRPLHRRRAAARQARRQHHDLLVRARLVLVHPARRRHDQHRRGLLAVLPEVARASRCPSSSATRSRCARRWPSGSPSAELVDERSTRPATTRTQREEQRRALPACSATPTPSSTRCSRRASTWRCRAPSTAPRVVEAVLDRPRRRGGRCGARFDRQRAARSARVLVVHLPRHQPDDARVLHGAAEPVPRQGGADLAARRRHLRQDADLARRSSHAQGALLPGLARQSRAHACALWKRRRFNIRDVEVPGIVSSPGGRAGPARAPSLAAGRRAGLVAAGAGRGAAVARAGRSKARSYKPGDPDALGHGRASRSGSSASASPALRFPDYRGSDQYQHLRPADAVLRLPRPDPARRPRRRPRDPVRRHAGSTVDVSSRRVGADRAARTTRRAQGMPDLAGTFEIGPNFNVELWQSSRPAAEGRAAPAAARGDHARALAARDRPHVLAEPQPRHQRPSRQGWNLGLLAGPLFGDQR